MKNYEIWLGRSAIRVVRWVGVVCITIKTVHNPIRRDIDKILRKYINQSRYLDGITCSFREYERFRVKERLNETVCLN